MQNTITLNGNTYPITKAELHIPQVQSDRTIYMSVESNSPAGDFALWEIPLILLKKLNELDGQRMHIKPDGETYDDDTLGSDIIRAHEWTDLNYWSIGDEEAYVYGEIQVDFTRIEADTYRVQVKMTLGDWEEDPEELLPECFTLNAAADFVVTVDEKNPME